MACRDRDTANKSGEFDYCIMEVRLKKKGAPATAKEDCRVMIVDSHWDTLNFVQQHMERCVGNVVKMKRLEEMQGRQALPAAGAVQQNLPVLLGAPVEHGGESLMDKLSSSLKKMLLILVMTRYSSDRDQACRVLGITREKLESELRLCGVSLA